MPSVVKSFVVRERIVIRPTVVHGPDARIQCLKVRIRIARRPQVFLGADAAAEPRSNPIPWYLWCMLAAAVSADVGCYWDIAWHRSIGRATFWSPPHFAVYLCGVLASIACGYLIFATTFWKSSYAKAATIRIWGCRGPAGAVLGAWGVVAMIASALFDHWWHEAYGLELKIMTPPHALLMVGLFAVQTGALVLVIGFVNRAVVRRGPYYQKLSALYFCVGSLMLILCMMLIAEFTIRPYMHSPLLYRAVSVVAPGIFAGLAVATSRRWAASRAAAGYSIFFIAMLWILPLFPASPEASPVFSNVTHMIPLEFPLLLIVPAIVLDILYLRIKHLNRLLLGLITGVVFLGLILPVQWLFSGFLQSAGARNWFFGAQYLDFSTRPDSSYALHTYFGQGAQSPDFNTGMLLALACAILSAWGGLVWGDWMRKIRR